MCLIPQIPRSLLRGGSISSYRKRGIRVTESPSPDVIVCLPHAGGKALLSAALSTTCAGACPFAHFGRSAASCRRRRKGRSGSSYRKVGGRHKPGELCAPAGIARWALLFSEKQHFAEGTTFVATVFVDGHRFLLDFLLALRITATDLF